MLRFKFPNDIERQVPAIKKGILKVKDYKNLSWKYDELGLEPGDNLLKTFLLQELSLSQFTFKSYDQYMMWKKIITHLKDTDKQSLEGYFLTVNGTLDFARMTCWIDEQIAAGVVKPFDQLKDSSRNDRRSEKRGKQALATDKHQPGGGREQMKKIVSLSHPHLKTFEALRKQLNEIGLANEPEDI